MRMGAFSMTVKPPCQQESWSLRIGVAARNGLSGVTLKPTRVAIFWWFKRAQVTAPSHQGRGFVSDTGSRERLPIRTFFVAYWSNMPGRSVRKPPGRYHHHFRGGYRLILWVKVQGENASSVVSTILVPHTPLISDG